MDYESILALVSVPDSSYVAGNSTEEQGFCPRVWPEHRDLQDRKLSSGG